MGKVTYTCTTCGTIYINDDGLGPFDGIIPLDHTSESCSNCHPENDSKTNTGVRGEWTQIIRK